MSGVNDASGPVATYISLSDVADASVSRVRRCLCVVSQMPMCIVSQMPLGLTVTVVFVSGLADACVW
jgi:hypothetical protein